MNSVSCDWNSQSVLVQALSVKTSYQHESLHEYSWPHAIIWRGLFNTRMLSKECYTSSIPKDYSNNKYPVCTPKNKTVSATMGMWLRFVDPITHVQMDNRVSAIIKTKWRCQDYENHGADPFQELKCITFSKRSVFSVVKLLVLCMCKHSVWTFWVLHV
jgi:hypothetical protein